MFGKLRDLAKRFFDGGDAARTGLSEEEIQAEFKRRYHSFKLLLTANKQALEVLSEMEEALHGAAPFGMAFIRSRATAASVNVYRMVDHLTSIAPSKYDALYERLKDIQSGVSSILEKQKAPVVGEALTIPLEEAGADLADQVGGKMAGLGEILGKTGLPVPPGFVITAKAYARLVEHNDLTDEINRLMQAAGPDDQEALLALSSKIRQRIIEAEIPNDVIRAIESAFAALIVKTGPDICVSLRSSALGEDAAGQTFAGQFASKLNVAADDIFQSYKEIAASKYSPQAMAYRLNRGIPDEDVPMCVGCMLMVEAESGGVMYSRNPLDIRDDSIFVHAAWGLPKLVVDGAGENDEFVIAREDGLSLVRRTIRNKERLYACRPFEGVCRMEQGAERAGDPCISDAKALELAEAAQKLETMHGGPVDVEWAMDASEKIYFLQCRGLVQMESSFERLPADGRYGEPVLRGGATASPGAASGPVILVQREADLLSFPQGGVMVCPEANPRWASVINKTAAIIAEKGGAAGHLANVAREFRVPAIMSAAGAVGAVAALAPGAEVTVDADGVSVYPGKIQELLDLAGPSGSSGPAPETRTPMHAVLRKVMDHITPLHLLDPNAPEFAPENCRTLHDVTRFCHEKSVTEMFKFGQEFSFSKRAAKQLKYKNAAMKWWFVNLDDGFFQEAPGKYVRLENIASRPVMALWDGFIAVPWEGPPPVDARGFMAIVARSASNPHLEAAAQSAFNDRNYFMISKEYMCLSSRFGYHFCTVEALVSERASENYVSFQFKGGAAEFNRRRRRADFVSAILERYGFATEVNEDSAFSRIAGGPAETMLGGLTVIGYLLMHTRQLDMIMRNNEMVTRYWNKITGDLDGLVGAASPPAAPRIPENQS